MPGTKSGVTDHEFLYLAVKFAPQIQFDFQKVGDVLGITKHSAYCRWMNLKKKFEAEAAAANGGSVPSSKLSPKSKRAGQTKRGKASVSRDKEDEVGEGNAKKKPKANSKQEAKAETVIKNEGVDEDEDYVF